MTTVIPFPTSSGGRAVPSVGSSGHSVGRASSRAVPSVGASGHSGGRASSRAVPSGSRSAGLLPRQKALVHIYKAAASLSDSEYRSILMRCAHVASAADPRFNQTGFDRVMAALETELATRVETKRVPRPSSRRITRLDYWRGKCPDGNRVNIRQRHAIEELWQRLAGLLGSAGTAEYLAGIIQKACGRKVLPHMLKYGEASNVIDALRSRLQTAIAPPKQEEEPCPF